MSRSSTRQIEEPQARVELLPERGAAVDPSGPTGSVQEAVATLPREVLERLWKPSYLERLAHAYWRHLRRISLGLLRIVYAPDSRSVVFAQPPAGSAPLPQARSTTSAPASAR